MNMNLQHDLLAFKEETGQTWPQIARGCGLTPDVVANIGKGRTNGRPAQREAIYVYITGQTEMPFTKAQEPQPVAKTKKHKKRNVVMAQVGIRPTARSCIDAFKVAAGLELDTEAASILINKGFECFMNTGIAGQDVDKYCK